MPHTLKARLARLIRCGKQRTAAHQRRTTNRGVETETKRNEKWAVCAGEKKNKKAKTDCSTSSEQQHLRGAGRERVGAEEQSVPSPFHIFASVTCALKHQHHDGIQGTEAQRGSSRAEVEGQGSEGEREVAIAKGLQLQCKATRRACKGERVG